MRQVARWFLLFSLMLAPVAAAAQAGTDRSAQAKVAAGPINLNSASEAELVSLPGVGPATAKKIIAGRPYASVAELAKAGVPKNTIGKITPLVTAGTAVNRPATQPSSMPAPAPPIAAPPAAAGARTTAAPAATQQPPAKGMVWVNLSTKVFHREGDRYYGTTKNGKFMLEADALKAGYREAKTAKSSKP